MQRPSRLRNLGLVSFMTVRSMLLLKLPSMFRLLIMSAPLFTRKIPEAYCMRYYLVRLYVWWVAEFKERGGGKHLLNV